MVSGRGLDLFRLLTKTSVEAVCASVIPVSKCAPLPLCQTFLRVPVEQTS